MKTKFLSLWVIILVVMFSNDAFSQEEDFSSKFTFKVEDARGNVDSVTFYVKKGATVGVDNELGEINLYGQEPKGDLDMRIIQRKTVNYSDEILGDFWLYGDYYGDYWMCPCKENIDLKFDYRYDATLDDNPFSSYPYSYVIDVYAKYYPVSIYLTSVYGFLHMLDWRQFDKESGEYVEGSFNGIYFLPQGQYEPPHFLCSFNEPSENKLLGFREYLEVSIEEDEPSKKQLYPNPSKEFIIIEDGKFDEIFTVVNIDGKIVKTVTVESYPYPLNILDLPKGTYFLKNKDNTVINKFIKE